MPVTKTVSRPLWQFISFIGTNVSSPDRQWSKGMAEQTTEGQTMKILHDTWGKRLPGWGEPVHEHTWAEREVTCIQRSCATAPLELGVGRTGAAGADRHMMVHRNPGQAMQLRPSFSQPLQCHSKHTVLQQDFSGFWDAAGSLVQSTVKSDASKLPVSYQVQVALLYDGKQVGEIKISALQLCSQGSSLWRHMYTSLHCCQNTPQISLSPQSWLYLASRYCLHCILIICPPVIIFSLKSVALQQCCNLTPAEGCLGLDDNTFSISICQTQSWSSSNDKWS